MKKNDKTETQKNWMDSTLDMDAFRSWGMEKQLDAIVEFAKTRYSLEKEFSFKQLKKSCVKKG